MKNTIKTLLTLALVAASLVAIESSAQLGTPSVVVKSASTPGAYAAITNNTTAYPTNAIIEVPRAKDVTLQFTSSLSGAGTTANTVTIQQSVDRSNWITHTVFAVTPAGTTVVPVITNLSVGGLPYLRVFSIANANGNTGFITNYNVTWSAK